MYTPISKKSYQKKIEDHRNPNVYNATTRSYGLSVTMGKNHSVNSGSLRTPLPIDLFGRI